MLFHLETTSKACLLLWDLMVISLNSKLLDREH